MKRAPEAPGASQRAHASPKRTVLAEEGGGTSFGTARSGSTCLEHGQSPSSPSWLQPQPSSGGLPPQPQSCPGPSRPSQLRAGTAPSRSPGLSFCGFPLCLQQHPRNIVSNQLSSFPTQSDFLHSAARPVPGDRATRATCWWSLSSSQLGQREKRDPGTAAVGLGDVQACGHSSPASAAVAVLVSRTKEAARGSTRDQSLSQGSWRSPRAVPRGSRCGQPLACFQQPAANWKEAESW